uniref:Sugar phosphate exchanger 3 n=1 Tax=Lygus hesperus TaxID=30085 RepID=A0A0A9XLT3_LYGHE
MTREIPLGIKSLRSIQAACFPSVNINSHVWYRVSIFILTFLSYTCYHASRKPISVVKSYFNQSCQNLTPPPDFDVNDTTWCDWAPFYGPTAGTLLGTLDSALLFAYAGAMFLSGYIAERMSLRYFLTAGMITSGIYCYLFGIAHKLEIHFVWYYILVQIFGGIVESSGWPGVVAVMSNWYGKSKRGLIMGIWNSHTSVGNILGTLIAARLLNYDWGYSFMVPGVIIAAMGLINFLFLVEHPADVGLSSLTPEPPPPRTQSRSYTRGEEKSPTKTDSDNPVGIIDAIWIPGVIEFSLSLFFAKLVCYTFLYWLPYYISASTTFSSEFSADVSTIFDVGGIVGGIFAGALTDYSGKSATVCCGMLLISMPLMFAYSAYGSLSFGLNVTLLALVGFFVNGPYALITTAVSADLGSHPSLAGNAKATATVTSLIDGTGSVGAAIGPLLAGAIFITGWQNVFYSLIAANLFALLMLLRLVFREWKRSLPRSLIDQQVM